MINSYGGVDGEARKECKVRLGRISIFKHTAGIRIRYDKNAEFNFGKNVK